MASKERLLDDMARLAGGAVNVISNVGFQIKDDLKSRAEEVALNLDLVPRAEFEKLEAMLQESRIQQEEILKRLDALEGKKGKK